MLAIIPARLGSKGLPRKNILLLNGKPLIAYTIEAALASRAITQTIVDTDSVEIAAIAKDFGAKVPYIRPPELAIDTTNTRDVCLNSLRWFESQGKFWNTFIILQPTSPLRRTEHIDEAIKIFTTHNADGVISVSEYSHPIQWAVKMGDHGELIPIGIMPTQRQMATQTYHPNGAIYIYDTKFYMKDCNIYGSTTLGYVMQQQDSLDIDTAWDFKLAGIIMKNFCLHID